MARKGRWVAGVVAIGLALAGCVSGQAGPGLRGRAQPSEVIDLELCDSRNFSYGVAGCVHVDEPPEPGYDPKPRSGGGTPLPDGLDYIRGVQCGGLLWALESVSTHTVQLRNGPRTYKPHGEGLLSMVGLYREWAGLLARETGQDTQQADALVLRDMTASRDDFLGSTRPGFHSEKTETLEQLYPGDIAACQSMAAAADAGILTILGG